MDPLTITTSIIALLQGGGAIAQGLKKLLDLRHAPQVLLEIDYEISDLRDVSTRVKEYLEGPAQQYTTSPMIELKLERAKKSLEDLKALVDSAVKSPNKISHRRWLKADGMLTKMRERLGKCKTDLLADVFVSAVMLSSAQHSQLNAIDSKLQDITSILSSSECSAVLIQPHPGMEDPVDTHTIEEERVPALDYERPEKSLVQLTLSPLREPPNHWSVMHENASHEHRIHRSARATRSDWKFGFWSLFSVSASYSNIGACDPTCRRCQSFKASAVKLVFLRVWSRVSYLRYCHFRLQGPEFVLRLCNVRPSDSDVFMYALHGRLPELNELFSAGVASVYDVNESGSTLLHIAMECADPVLKREMVAFLFTKRADVMQECFAQVMPYHRYWMEFGDPLNPFSQEAFGQALDPELCRYTPLHCSILGVKGALPFDETFESTSRSQIDEKDALGRTALAVASGSRREWILNILAKGADPNARDVFGRTPLSGYLISGDASFVQLLVAAGADCAARDFSGLSLMHQIIEECASNNMMDLCLNLQRDINARNNNQRTVLHYLALLADNLPREESVRMLQWLLSHGADVNAIDKTGSSVLHLALCFEWLPILLKVDGIITDRPDGVGLTILHRAALGLSIASLELLRNSSLTVDHNAMTKDGNDALAIARASERKWRAKAVRDGDGEAILQYDAWLKAFERLWDDVRERNLLQAASRIIAGDLESESSSIDLKTPIIPGAFVDDE